MKLDSEIKNNTLLIVFFVVIITQHLTGDIGGIVSILTIPFIYSRKNEFEFDNRLYRLAIFFVFYMVIFSFISINKMESFVATIDVVRSFVLFYVGYLFCSYLDKSKIVWLISVIFFGIISANWFFPKIFLYPPGIEKIFYSYHNGPNPSAFMYAFFIVISCTLFFMSKNIIEKFINLFSIIFCMYFVCLTNSRSVWIAIAVSILFFFCSFLKKSNLMRISVIFVVLLFSCFVYYIFDIKGASSSYRDTIWKNMILTTIENKLFLGYGIDTSKDVLEKINLGDIAVYTHNSVVEVFSSSGIIGLICFAAIFTYFFSIVYGFDHFGNIFVLIGKSALICFFIISLLDFRLFSYRFFSTIMIFIGFCQYGFLMKNKIIKNP